MDLHPTQGAPRATSVRHVKVYPSDQSTSHPRPSSKKGVRGGFSEDATGLSVPVYLPK